MTRPLAITKKQAQTLLKAAKAEGAVIEVETPIGKVRLIPADLDKSARDRVDDGDLKGTM